MLCLCSRQDKKGEVKVAFCPTTNMLTDFFMKPLQGSTFKRMQSIILNMPDTDKTSIEHRSVLENEKKSWENKQKLRGSSNVDANSENMRKEPKQRETRLNGRINKNNKNERKNEILQN